jgi:sulfofructose kinase
VPEFDVVGVGLNATDTLILLDHFPPYAGKVPFSQEILSPGGQVASAMVVCAALGLRVKYIGTVGDDLRGRVQLESLRGLGIDLEDVQVRPDCANQTAYILIDRSTGERTVLWARPDCLRLNPEDIRPETIRSARLVHIDGHDTPAVARAAELARGAGIPVTLDIDTVYPHFERVLQHVDVLIASSEWPAAWTHEKDPLRALELLAAEYKLKVAAMTLGAHGALALANGRFHYSPAFVVNCADTTGAGDAFHGAWCFGLLSGWDLIDTMDFSNAMAALNCTALGARGHIASLTGARELMARAERRVAPDFARYSR